MILKEEVEASTKRHVKCEKIGHNAQTCMFRYAQAPEGQQVTNPMHHNTQYSHAHEPLTSSDAFH